MLKEIADKAASCIAATSSDARGSTAFSLRDVVQQKLQARGLYSDVLDVDAACLCADRPNAFFIDQWTKDLDHLAQNAFGWQQAETM